MRGFIVFVLMLTVLPAYAQVTLTQTIRGTVKDASSQQPVPGATVVIVGTNPPKGTITDEEGNFRLEQVKVGRVTLKINSVGYEEQLLSELSVGSGKEVILNISLTESLIQMQEVVITAEQAKGTPRNDMAVLSARSISVDETKRYAASINDPARAALSFAGVSGNDDGNNGLVVRGNSPRGMLWRLEGVEIPNPNHFGEEGASSGGISILSVNMLDNSDFFTGAFPSEYGNALSGVFDVRLRKGNNEKYEYAAQMGLLGVDFAAEGPFSKNSKASYLANYRYSTLGILQKIGVNITGDATPDFQDFSYKVYLPTPKAGTFSLWGVGGLSRQTTRAIADSTQWKKFSDREHEEFVSKMMALGMTHFYYLNDKSYLQTIVSFSSRGMSYVRDVLNRKYVPIRFQEEDYTADSWRISTLWNHKFNARHTLRTGLIYSNIGFSLLSNGITDEGVFYTDVSTSGRTSTWQAYSQWKYRVSETVTLNTGLHMLYLALNGNTSIEPRASLKWQFSARQSLALGTGWHSRYEAMSVYFAGYQPKDQPYTQPNRNLGFTKARHLVLSYENRLREDMRLKVETYYQQLYNVPVNVQSSSFSGLNSVGGYTIDALTNNGTGRNYGVEFTLEKFLTHNYYFLVTTSLYQSLYTGSDGKERNTRFNGNFVSNATFGKEFMVGRSKANVLGINIRLLWAGGNRYTPVDLEKSRLMKTVIEQEGQQFSAQVSNYFRTDLRFSYKKNRPKASYTLSLDIQNATNRLNVFTQEYKPASGNVEYSYQLGLIPVLNYRIEF